MKQSKNTFYGIGIDIGGTKISITLGNRSGKILAKKVLKTPQGRGFRRIFKEVRQASEMLVASYGLKWGQIKGVGVGVPGLYNAQSGVIEVSPNMRDWVGVNLLKELRKVFKKPVRIENDANATVIAEKLFGQGKGCSSLIYMTVSTGLGAGILLDGRLVRGASSSGGEAGHMVVRYDGDKNSLKVPGTLEGESSGLAIARKAGKVASKSKRLSALKKSRNLSSKTVKEAVLKGDRVAKGVLEEAGYFLGIGLANLVMTLNPEMIILGGGVLKGRAGNIVFQAAKESVKNHTWPAPHKTCKIVKTKFLEDIADLGALSLVFA